MKIINKINNLHALHTLCNDQNDRSLVWVYVWYIGMDENYIVIDRYILSWGKCFGMV